MKHSALVMVGLLSALALAMSRRLGAVAGEGGTLSRGEVAAIVNRVNATWFAARLDPLMIRAMVEIESAGNTAAYRYEAHIQDASVGLMQTLLSTARWLASDMGYRSKGIPDLVDLLDAETSIYFGCAYVAYLSRWRGVARSERWIVESYNGGPGNSNAQTVNHWNKYLAAKARL